MRSLFVLILLSVLSLTARAQITFTASDYLSKIIGVDHYLFRALDTAGLLDIAMKSGADQLWDFTGRSYTSGSITRYTLEPYPGSGLLASNPAFQNSTHVRSYKAGVRTNFSYYTVNDSGYWINGTEQDSAGRPSIQIYYTPPEHVCRFPLVFGDSWSNDMMQYLPAMKDSNHIIDHWTVDAWGTIVLPGIGGVPAIRAYLVRPDSSIGIAWYTLTGDYANFTTFPGSHRPDFAFYIADNASVPLVLASDGSGWLNLRARGKTLLLSSSTATYGALHATIFDALGRNARSCDVQEVGSGTYELELGSLPCGAYLVRLSDDSRTMVRKIVIGQ